MFQFILSAHGMSLLVGILIATAGFDFLFATQMAAHRRKLLLRAKRVQFVLETSPTQYALAEAIGILCKVTASALVSLACTATFFLAAILLFCSSAVNLYHLARTFF